MSYCIQVVEKSINKAFKGKCGLYAVIGTCYVSWLEDAGICLSVWKMID